MSGKPRLLIVDDEKHTREGLGLAMAPHYEVILAANAQGALDRLKEEPVDLLLTDLRMPELDGVSFLRKVQKLADPPVCIMLTAYGSIETAVAAMRAGAYDYITKPVDLENLELLLRRALEHRTLRRENRELKRALASAYSPENIIGKSAAMQEVLDKVRQIAPARSTVLLTGESGTGKELIAHALHDLGNRSDKGFVTVHCAALPEQLLQSELFGHEKGAFTHAVSRRTGRFEAADGGTLFLDEIGDISPAVQVTLLRFLETRTFERVGGNASIEVDVRLIAATNRNLREQVAEGKFREDLYYRLDVLRLHIPPLRDRRDDVPLLLQHFLRLFKAENGGRVEGFSPAALDLLTAYDWPGNVRELRNCVERLVVMCSGTQVQPDELPEAMREGRQGQRPVSATPATLDIEANEKELIQRALAACDGNRTAAARKLGISRRTLHRKLNEYGLR